MGTPKSIQQGQKWLQGSALEASWKGFRKNNDFRSPWTVKMRLPCRWELNFHFSKGFPNDFQSAPKMEPEWLPNLAQGHLGPLRASIQKMREKRAKLEAKWEPKLRPNVTPNRSKKVSKNSVDSKRGPRGSPLEPSRTILGSFFEYCWAHAYVFPCVFYDYLVSIGFPRVFAVLSL